LDVFISYAHADNEVPEGAATELGWVTMLARNLNVGPNVYKKNLFIDHQLRPGDVFSEELVAKVEGSTLLVVLLSQNYIKSRWCGQELACFVNRRGRAEGTTPQDVFVAELTPYDDLIDPPPTIQSLRKHLTHSKFWHRPPNASAVIVAGYPSPKESRKDGADHYWAVLAELRAAIDHRLRQIEARGATLSGPGEDQSVRPQDSSRESSVVGHVLLADVTDDLEAQRNSVRAALEAEHVVVLPRGDYVGLDVNEFDAAIQADLLHADLFVQLLSPTVGRKQRGFAAPMPQLQFQRAMEARIPLMQWSTELPHDVEAQHAKLFATEFLQITHLASFKANVLKALKSRKEQQARQRAPRAASSARSKRKVVFVDDIAGEQALSERLRAIIKNHKCDIRRAPVGDHPSFNIKEMLKPCRGGLTIFTDRSKHITVYNRLVYFLNQIAEADLEVTRWGVYLDHGGSVYGEFGIESDDVVPVSEQGLPEFLHGL
jgi:hypothetical protein